MAATYSLKAAVSLGEALNYIQCLLGQCNPIQNKFPWTYDSHKKLSMSLFYLI